MKYAVIIPVYNRPDEVRELLESLTRQTFKDFEVIIVEDGSDTPCGQVIKDFEGKLPLHYYVKPNSGPGPTRNFGVAHSNADYVLILDSDVVLPDGYIAAIEHELNAAPCDAFGGPDRAHDSFTPMQKAISYAMTSFFTTGGIRGGKKKMDKFYPRSYNMGIRRTVYEVLDGFAPMRFGEDIDLSTRIFKGGYRCRLFPEAWVWHKRRTDLRKFYKQVYNSGIARINLTKRHPGTLKLVHLLPAAFTLSCILLILLAISAMALGCAHGLWLLAPLVLYALLIFVDATAHTHSLYVGALAIATSYVQLWGYGLGFLYAWWKRYVRRKGEFDAFTKNFYK